MNTPSIDQMWAAVRPRRRLGVPAAVNPQRDTGTYAAHAAGFEPTCRPNEDATEAENADVA
jgi:hypothetical protein